MKLKPDIREKTGLYLGTETEEKWWRRYTKHRLLARGNGRYWTDEKAFYFLRYLTREPITILFESVLEFKTGNWHSGRWCFGYPVLKIIWLTDGLRLSSGFLVSKNSDEVAGLISELKKKVGTVKSDFGVKKECL